MEKEKKVKFKNWFWTIFYASIVIIIEAEYNLPIWAKFVLPFSCFMYYLYLKQLFPNDKNQESIKKMSLITVEINFMDDNTYPMGGYFTYNIYKEELKNKWLFFKERINKNIFLWNGTDQMVIEYLNNEKDWNINFKQGKSSIQGKRILDKYYDDCICDIITEIKITW